MKNINKIKTGLFIIVGFVVFSCNITTDFPKIDPNETLNELRIRKYAYSNYINDHNETVHEITVRETTIFRKGDIDLIGKLTITLELKFFKAKIEDFLLQNFESCHGSKISRIRVSNSKLNNLQICRIARYLNSKKISVEFYNSKFDELDLECFAKLPNLDSFAYEGIDPISEGQFCNFTEKAQKLTYLRLSDTLLSPKSLKCMLGLPSLKGVMLLRWKNVS
ncbi:hypothetical protein ND861_07390 [Leptospira sp. 2 VSF19]|uniref:Lipoprotein n=1 Tax=Leptospira soteropolitanensis TaxID=2950025 RepID=A0AAW5VAC0_9LEPT|nr:hypothetical protein [Leptospira soteropolitanensis]MCW7492818.1 hypothetical protein [Leptospira soteropolitanensis]MCW7500053.1 hypothetical protein [Leptospira soteropolitanensis]MCW7522304.1 hypothetical protein [Leptospira soteropolitanensis]MCW7526160.1 hypothetical protein [Leptospira soteropolitanensis]MCW7529728.1 hypothetical protein [Leptospira soteropolitanensis]